MKPELKRIEAALQQVASHYLADSASLPEEMVSCPLSSSTVSPRQPESDLPSDKFERLTVDAITTSLESLLASELGTPSVEPGPALPEFTASQENQQAFIAFTNSALATSLLKDLQTKVGEWMAALEAVIQQIQALYEEGPIVDGWLESFNADGSFDADARRIAIAKALQIPYTAFPQDVVAQVEATTSAIPSSTAASGKTAYRLCGLREDGQVWCRYCPHEQIPDVSLAIVRYQRLQTLLLRKQSLEQQLGALTEALIDVHSRIVELTE